eukprot:scaffold9298_cov150-Amphora_coffeaeformis.AAC.2
MQAAAHGGSQKVCHEELDASCRFRVLSKHGNAAFVSLVAHRILFTVVDIVQRFSETTQKYHKASIGTHSIAHTRQSCSLDILLAFFNALDFDYENLKALFQAVK